MGRSVGNPPRRCLRTSFASPGPFSTADFGVTSVSLLVAGKPLLIGAEGSSDLFHASVPKFDDVTVDFVLKKLPLDVRERPPSPKRRAGFVPSEAAEIAADFKTEAEDSLDFAPDVTAFSAAVVWTGSSVRGAVDELFPVSMSVNFLKLEGKPGVKPGGKLGGKFILILEGALKPGVKPGGELILILEGALKPGVKPGGEFIIGGLGFDTGVLIVISEFSTVALPF